MPVPIPHQQRTMIDAVATPSQRIKRLHRKSGSKDTSLKDFAIEISSNGTRDEKQLVEDWFACKAGEAKPPEKKVVEPEKKVLKKR